MFYADLSTCQRMRTSEVWFNGIWLWTLLLYYATICCRKQSLGRHVVSGLCWQRLSTVVLLPWISAWQLELAGANNCQIWSASLCPKMLLHMTKKTNMSIVWFLQHAGRDTLITIFDIVWHYTHEDSIVTHHIQVWQVSVAVHQIHTNKIHDLIISMHPTYLQRHGRHGRHGHHGPGWTLLGGEAACPPKDLMAANLAPTRVFALKLCFKHVK